MTDPVFDLPCMNTYDIRQYFGPFYSKIILSHSFRLILYNRNVVIDVIAVIAMQGFLFCI